MANRDSEIDYSRLTDVLRFAIEEYAKLSINTCIPGIVKSYDRSSKRAVVQPAIRRILTDNTTMELPEIVNVPVIHPSGGGFTVLLPVAVGDSVPLFFSQRGLSRFKTGYSISDPDGGLFDLKDAFAVVGFGALSIAPASTSGVSMQSDDAANTVTVENGTINITTTGVTNVNAPTSVNVTTAAANITAPTSTFNGNVQINGSVTWTGTAQGQGGPAQFSGGIVNTGGNIVSDGVGLETHTHNQGNDSAGNTEVPTNAPNVG